MTALVDDDDYERISQHSWTAQCRHDGGPVYAVRTQWVDVNKWTRGHLTVMMHREILGDDCPNAVDHIDRNGLNNCRSNLRSATTSQNSRNKAKSLRPLSSRFKGVHWAKTKRAWRAEIKLNGKKKHLGYFQSETDAALAYDEAARAAFGEFAYLNFPQLKAVS